MKQGEFLGIAAFFAVAMAQIAGCEAGSDTGQGGGSDGSQSASSVASASSVVSASSSAVASSSGGVKGDGNDTFATAEPIGIDDSADGELDPTGDVDYYQFDGKAGQYLMIDIDAEYLDDVSFDPAHIDTIVTLFDADQKQIAENNNYVPSYATADSRLYTRLPADGTYYLRVEECWTWSKSPAGDCLGTADKDGTAYSLYITEMDPAVDAYTLDPEEGNTETSAAPIEYKKANGGGYYTSEIFGDFTDKSDTDVFSFTLPADIPSSPETRSAAEFFLLDAGKSGTGSTTPIGRAYITTAADPQTVLVEVYGSVNDEISAPLATGTPYFLFLKHPDTTWEANDFYFVRHYGTYGNPVETAEPANDALATAEALTLKSNGSGFKVYIEGDLAPAASDVDHFKITVPAQLVGKGTISVTCGAERDGSGLRDLTVSLFDGAGNAIMVDPVLATETTSQYARVNNAPLPVGVTDIVARLQASQDVVVKSSYYRCGFYVNP